MPINKHALIRYHALDKCFGNRYKRYYIEDLIEACNNAIYELTGVSDGVKRRQIFADMVFMESPQGWNIPLDRVKDGHRVYYTYYDRDFTINEQPLSDTEIKQLRETITMLDRFKGMPGFEWMDELLSNLEYRFYLNGTHENVIGFEQNEYLTGIEYLSPIFQAIINKQVLNIDYRSFNNGKVIKWDLHPYYIKQYNTRWFLFGLSDDYHTITNVPLDRIQHIKTTEKPYIANKDIDFREYFSNIIGVTFPPDRSEKKILLKFSPERFPYIVSKPLHETQRIMDKEKGIIEITVIPNKELMSLIFSFAEDVDVLKPECIRTQIKEKISELSKKYFSVQKD